MLVRSCVGMMNDTTRVDLPFQPSESSSNIIRGLEGVPTDITFPKATCTEAKILCDVFPRTSACKGGVPASFIISIIDVTLDRGIVRMILTSVGVVSHCANFVIRGNGPRSQGTVYK